MMALAGLAFASAVLPAIPDPSAPGHFQGHALFAGRTGWVSSCSPRKPRRWPAGSGRGNVPEACRFRRRPFVVSAQRGRRTLDP